MAPRRKSGKGYRSNPLSLLQHYRRDPEPFARPGPPPAPPLPLKFTCRECGETVHPDAYRCSRCRHILRPDDGHST